MDLKEKLITTMLDATKYTGSTEKETKKISASSFDSEPMQLYLRYKYGDQDNNKDFTASTAGSLLQLGVDSIFGSMNDFKIATRVEKVLPNGFVVSGETDLISEEYKAIIDFKLLAGAGFKKVLSRDSYVSNMSIYNWLFDNKYPNSYLFAINKAGSSVRGNQYAFIDYTDCIWNYDEVEEILIDKTNEIQHMIDHPEDIPECNVFEYGKSKTGVPNKCEYYCSFKNVCPDYKKRMEKNNYHALKALI